MRRTVRSMVALAAVAACGFFPVTPVGAASGPNYREWWFPSWGIQDKIWPITRGQGVTVAVVDTGVNASLPDLSGVVLRGKNLLTGSDGRTDTDSEANSHGHGTSMAITIAGQGDRYGWLGVAPDVKILPIVDSGDTETISTGIRYAVDHGAKVVNMSLGLKTDCPDAVQQAVAYAADHQVVVIAAAGNEGEKRNPSEYPANCAGVLAVGAAGKDLRPWSGSERQPYVGVSAAGFQVGLIGSDGILYEDSWGTSIATAFTSAEAAMIMSRYPQLTARQVVQRIIATVKPLGGQVPDPATGYGYIRFTRALTDTVPADAPNPVFDALDAWKAAQHPAANGPASAPVPPSTAASGHGSGLSIRVVFLAGVAAFVLLMFVAVFVIRVMRRPAASPAPYQPSTPPSFGAGPSDQSPPRSYGPPPGHQ
jgi:subtilisin family serine protease